MDKKTYNHDCESFADAVESICNIIGFSEAQTKETVYANLETFKCILDRECSPQECFDPIAAGAFKEAYYSVDPREQFVIKFATEDNETENEWYIYDESAKYGVQDFFLPSIYRRLQSCCLPAEIIGENDSYRYVDRTTYWTDSQGVRRMTYTQTVDENWEPSVFNFICTQPFARPARDIGYTRLYPLGSSQEEREFNYHRNPLVSGDTIIPWELARELSFDIDDHEWWQQAIDIYGMDKCMALYNFIEDYGVHDLHSANYGYMIKDGKELPIIMDWLSG